MRRLADASTLEALEGLKMDFKGRKAASHGGDLFKGESCGLGRGTTHLDLLLGWQVAEQGGTEDGREAGGDGRYSERTPDFRGNGGPGEAGASNARLIVERGYRPVDTCSGCPVSAAGSGGVHD